MNYMWFLTFLLFVTVLLKCFIYSRVGILDSPWCDNSCRTYQELGEGDFYSFNQRKVLILSIFYYVTKKNVTMRKIMLTLIFSIAFVIDRHLWACKSSEFFFLLLFLVSCQPSTATLRFPDS